MLRPAAILALLLSASAGLAADDLPPGILLLSRIKRHVREQLERLPDYTCLETAVRYRRKAGEKPRAEPSDVVILEVLYAGDKELYGSPGARDFLHDNPTAFTAGGMSGNGVFALHLRTLFVHDNAMFQYRGEEGVAGRRAVRYDYRVPLMLSGFTIYLEYSHGTVSTKGSIWADPDTLDLLRLEVRADDIPVNLPLVSAAQTVDYERTRIGAREVMLPQSAIMEILQTNGEESRNFIEYTHCRSFAVESSVSFDEPAVPAASDRALPRVDPPPVPSGLLVPIELTTPISGGQAIGALIEGRVAAAVMEKGRLAIPAGAAVRGRIRRLEHDGAYLVVGLEFTEIQTPAGPARFYANLQDLDKRSSVKLSIETTAPEERLYLRYLPGVASFFVSGSPQVLPKGFRTIWKTTSPRSATR